MICMAPLSPSVLTQVAPRERRKPCGIGVDVSGRTTCILWVHDPRVTCWHRPDGQLPIWPARGGVFAPQLTDLPVIPICSEHPALPVICGWAARAPARTQSEARCQALPLTGCWVWMPTTHAWIYARCRG